MPPHNTRTPQKLHGVRCLHAAAGPPPPRRVPPCRRRDASIHAACARYRRPPWPARELPASFLSPSSALSSPRDGSASSSAASALTSTRCPPMAAARRARPSSSGGRGRRSGTGPLPLAATTTLEAWPPSSAVAARGALPPSSSG